MHFPAEQHCLQVSETHLSEQQLPEPSPFPQPSMQHLLSMQVESQHLQFMSSLMLYESVEKLIAYNIARKDTAKILNFFIVIKFKI